MKRLFAVLLCITSACGLHAQAVDATVCEILKAPQSFNGKVLRIKATVSAGFDEFVIKGGDCGQKINAIWLAYPEGTKGKAGPAAMLTLQPARNFGGEVTAVNRTPVTLDKNKDFKQFDSLLSTPLKTAGLCLGCVRYDVAATLVGRLDGIEPGINRNAQGKITGIQGFGNLNAYSARLVLQSVSDVTPQEVDPNKTYPARGTGSVAQQFGSGVPLEEQIKRAHESWGKQGDDNGVSVGGVSNEAVVKLESKANTTSPDGVIYNCGFDFDHLKGDAMGLAMQHIGQHIVDLRNPEAGLELAGLSRLELRAWVTTALSSAAFRQKTLFVPGGKAIFNGSWNPVELNNNTANALADLLKNEQASE